MNAAGYKDKVLFERANQTLTFEAGQGRPSADGTVALYDPRYARDDAAKNPIVSGTATRKAIDTTVTSASGYSQTNQKRVNCTPPAAMAVGDRVWLTTADGKSEYVEVEAKAAAYFDTVYPLAYDYVNGDAIKSAVMTSPAIPTAWVEDKTNLGEDYEAVWTYTVAGQTYVVTSRFDLVREVVDFGLPENEFFGRWPEAKRWSRLEKDPQLYARMEREMRKEVEKLFRKAKLDPDKVRGNELAKTIVSNAMAVQFGMNGWCPNGWTAPAWTAEVRRDYEDDANSLLGGTLKLPYDNDEDGILSGDDYAAQAVELVR